MSATRTATLAFSIVLASSVMSIFVPSFTQAAFMRWLSFIGIYFAGSALVLVGYPMGKWLKGFTVRSVMRSGTGDRP